MAVLVSCLQALREEFDETFPDRGRGSDGWIGDAAHQARDSDHNPDERGIVHAIDVTADLGPGASMHDVIDVLLRHCRAGTEHRLTYMIYDRTIWSRSVGWRPAVYTGDNPHTKHAHFSASDNRALEQDIRTWHLEETPMTLTPEDKDWIRTEIRKVFAEDGDPTDKRYSRDGQRTTTLERTGRIANVDIPEIKKTLADLTEAVAAIRQGMAGGQ